MTHAKRSHILEKQFFFHAVKNAAQGGQKKKSAARVRLDRAAA